MNEGARSRWPWLLWGIAPCVLVAGLALSVLNETGPGDFSSITIAIAMVLGYSTVGALLASRNPGNPIGWLMMTIGILFGLALFTDEYLIYTYETDPGALPFGPVVALVTSTVWTPMLASVGLLALLFPTGRVPTPRWRFLPPTIVAATIVFLVGSSLGVDVFTDISVDVRIENPIHVAAIGSVGEAIAGLGAVVVLLGGLCSVAALVLRYRRSRGEERLQVRWLAYVGATLIVVILLAIVMGLVVGEDFGQSWIGGVLFIGAFALIGIGVPVALGVAVLRFRLYDLDVVIRKTVQYGVLVVVFMLLGFVAVAAVPALVLGVGAAPDILPTLLVAAVVTAVFLWLRPRAARLANRFVYGKRATPYEVLSEFSERVGETYSTDDVLPRMAQVVAEATGARRSDVWLAVGSTLRPEASWPADAEEPTARKLVAGDIASVGGEHLAEVRHQGELLGAITLEPAPDDPMDPAKELLVRDLAGQAGLVLRNVRLIEELRASRQRLVAAQDAERRKLERNIHDGVQQQLVALTVQMRLAEQLAERDPPKTREMLAGLQGQTNDALEDLRDLARGIYPPLLADKGLGAALTAQARKAAVPTIVAADDLGRYPQEVEAAVYFTCLEALSNTAKYAGASQATITLAQRNGALEFTVSDDGVGFDPAEASHGTGLQGIADRLDAIGGTVRVESAPGHGTTLVGAITTEEVA